MRDNPGASLANIPNLSPEKHENFLSEKRAEKGRLSAFRPRRMPCWPAFVTIDDMSSLGGWVVIMKTCHFGAVSGVIMDHDDDGMANAVPLAKATFL